MARELSGGFNFPGYAALPSNAPEILTRNTIYLKSSEKVEPLVAAERARNFDGLVRRYIKQLLYGCQRGYCDTPTCYTARKRFSRDSNASRRFSVLSARIIACQLATQPSPYNGLCQGKPVIPVLSSRSEEKPRNQSSSSFREEIADDGEDTSNKENKDDPTARLLRGLPQEAEVEIITDKGLRDPRSFQQQLFNTKPFKMLEWIGLPPLGKLVFDFASSPTPAGEEPNWPVLNGDDNFEIPPEEPPRFQADTKAMEVIDTGLLDGDSEPVSQLKHQEIMQHPVSRKRRTSSSNPTKMTLRDVTPTPHANARSKMSTPGAWNHAMPPLPPRGHDLRKAKTMPFQTPQVTPSRSEKHSTTVQSLVSESEILPPQSLNKLDVEICTALYNMCADVTASSAQRHDAGLFARQSIFYVFSTPEALQNSFVSASTQAHPDGFDLNLDDLDHAFRTLFQNESWETLIMQSLWTGLDVLFKTSSGEGAGMVSVKGATRAILISLHALAAAVPRGTPSEWEMVRKARQIGRASVQGYNNRIAFDDEMAQRLLRKVAEGIAFRVFVRKEGEVVRMMRKHFTSCEVFQRQQRVKFAEELEQDVGEALGRERGGWGLAVCTLEWCRATFLKVWDGREAMNKLGPAGCCLSLIDILYPGHFLHGLEAEYFHTPVIADRFSPRETPVEWNRAKPHEMVLHLISRPYLFRESVRVTYFRAINLHQMTKSYEQSMTAQRLATQMALNTQLPSPDDDRIYQRMRIPLTNCLLVEVHRETILQDALNQIYGRELRELRRPLKVRYTNEGEEGVDHGGVQQDFFIVALREALRPEYGMFTTDEQSRMSWFSVCPLEPIHKYKLIGMLCGLAVYNGVTLPVTFPAALYMKLLRYTPKDIEHIKDGWGPLAKGLRQLLDWDDGDVGDVFMRTYEFSYESYGQVKSLDMLSAKKKGIEYLEEKFNKITRMKARSWLPPVPSITRGDEDQWVGNLTQELDGIARSEDPSIARRPSYRVSILEWPADAAEDRARAAQTADRLDSPDVMVEDGTEVSDEDSGFGKEGKIGNDYPSTIRIAPGVEYRPARPPRKDLQNMDTPCTTKPKPPPVMHSSRSAEFPGEEAPLVTNKNRKQYVKDYIAWLTDRSVRRQYKAFESGFFTIVGHRSLMLFTPETLRTLVEGIQEIDVAELEKTARYEDGYDVNHRVIKDFWAIVRGFSDEQCRMLLEFVTASSRVPANGISSILFVIQRNGPDSDRVPTSLTCFGRLLLPEYSSKKKLKEKLELALENGKGFGVP